MIVEGVVIPPELEQHGNGQLPGSVLAPLGIGSFVAWEPCARAFRALRLAAFGAGVDLSLTGSYRSLDRQMALFRERYTPGRLPGRPTKTWDGQTWSLKPGMAQAATPGTSVHGWGLAVDFAEERGEPYRNIVALTTSTIAWLREHAPALGWAATVPSEPWHWVLQGWQSYARTSVVPPSIPTTDDEESSMLVRGNGEGHDLPWDQPGYAPGYEADLKGNGYVVWDIDAHGKTLPNAHAVHALVAAGRQVAVIDQALLDAVPLAAPVL